MKFVIHFIMWCIKRELCWIGWRFSEIFMMRMVVVVMMMMMMMIDDDD